jgi:polyferredoxin
MKHYGQGNTIENLSALDASMSEERTSLRAAHDLHRFRRMTQIAFILIIFFIPVLNIFRYDSATQDLIVLGHVWSLGLKQGFYADHSLSGATHVALHFFLKAILPWVLLLSLFPILGYFTGRFFCGWFCPEGALFEWADYLTLNLLGRRSLYSKKPNDPEVKKDKKLLSVILAAVSIVIVPLIGGITLTSYLVAPKTVWHQIMSWDFTFGVKAGIIGVSLYMLIGSLFVRHAFCKYVCAAGFMQTLFGWVSPVSLRLKMDSARLEECTDCKGCEKACFMNVLPRRNKRDISCVNCGVCIDACNRELGEGKGLFHFDLGKGKCLGPEKNCRVTPIQTTGEIK